MGCRGVLGSACCPVVSDTPGYVKEPSLAEKVHCVAFVVSGLEISSYSDTMKSTFHQLRELISALDIHQVALLTHVDKVCPKTASDVSQVYKSSPVKYAMVKASALLGMPLSSIVPVKNYSEELELDPHTHTLLLRALDHILQYVDLHLRDQGPERGNTGGYHSPDSVTAQRANDADDAQSVLSLAPKPSSLFD
ncbi:hypothetical protein AALO_G00132370 [Alosa alosa]|uniref:Interferon-induced protein 44-like n=1 Tax=Alosa alosa TaxID=278164 RepID=A0AAV6GRG9_9TELE|nr:hypothetical protein AALO_G00132370 [Alosa alosa]